MRGTERLSPNSPAGRDASVRQFIAAGLSVRHAYAAAPAPVTFMVSSVQFSLGVDRADPREQEMRRRLFESLGPEHHPVLTAHAGEISRMGNPLAALPDGIEAQIS